jgi:hypothetical protein
MLILVGAGSGVEREMRVMYQQPHLVPPMKLTVFDELPSTPTPAPPSQVSQWMAQGKASLRSSLSMRRHAASSSSSRIVISSPKPPLPSTDQLPFRRPGFHFRPLELSIYVSDNRLSDLPEFDRLSFTEVGEIKLPTRALLRTTSEQIVPHKISMLPAPAKPASMIEQRRLSHVRPDTLSTVQITSRPPSEHDALHSHPVSWASLPALPPQTHLPGRSEPSMAMLTPMQEEFSPVDTSATIDGPVLDQLKDFDTDQPVLSLPAPPSAPPSPDALESAPLVPAAPNTRNFSKPTDTNTATVAGYFHPNYQTQKRISQWLSHRTSSSTSTAKSSSTTASFTEHRRKRSQFYQLSHSSPKPLQLSPSHHQRTTTESTVASSVDTDLLSVVDYASQTNTSVTSVDMQSRTGAVRTVVRGLRPIVSGVPDVPPCYVEVVKEPEEIIIKEIGGPLRSPGVGVAF